MASLPGGLRQNAARLAVLFALVMVVVSSIIQTQGALFTIRNPIPDSIGNFEQQLTDLRRDLPPRGVVGWISDRPYVRTNLKFAQYSLAPVILAEDGRRDLVIGHFYEQSAGRKLMETWNLETAHDYGGGVMLLRRAP